MAPDQHLRRLDLVTIIIFFGLLLGAAIPTAFPQSKILPNENRPRTGRPQFTLSRWLENIWQPRVEKYLSDRFGGRAQLVTANAFIHLIGLQTSPHKLVEYGRDGWLLYAGEQTLDDFRRRRPLTAQQVATVGDSLQRIQDEMNAQGRAFGVLIAPATGTIYPEVVPSRFQPLAGPTRFDQLAEYLRTKTTVSLVDPRPALIAAKAIHPVYAKTDTHWNAYGALVTAIELLKNLKSQDQRLTAPRLEEYQLTVRRSSGGDLAHLVSLPNFYQEDEPVLRPRFTRRATEVEVEYPGVELVQPPDGWETGDQTLPIAVVFRDSYSNAMMPILAEHFRRIVFIRAHQPIQAILDLEKPDVVVLESAERYIHLLGTNGIATDEAGLIQ